MCLVWAFAVRPAPAERAGQAQKGKDTHEETQSDSGLTVKEGNKPSKQDHRWQVGKLELNQTTEPSPLAMKLRHPELT